MIYFMTGSGLHVFTVSQDMNGLVTDVMSSTVHRSKQPGGPWLDHPNLAINRLDKPFLNGWFLTWFYHVLPTFIESIAFFTYDHSISEDVC